MVVRCMIQEKASNVSMNELATEIKMKTAQDVEKISTEINDMAKVVDINQSIEEVRNQLLAKT